MTLGWYGQSLNSLIRGLEAGAIGGSDALEALLNIETERRERKAERREAAHDAMQDWRSSLTSLAMGEAQEGTSLDDLVHLASAQSQGMGMPALERTALTSLPGISDLYVTNPDSRNFGLSRVAPSVPATAIADLHGIVAAEYESPSSKHLSWDQSARAAAHDIIQTRFGPKMYARMASEIDEIVNDAIKRMGG